MGVVETNVSSDGVTYTVALSDVNDHIQKHLLTGEPYEHKMVRDIRNRTDGLVVDVGANIGNHSLFLAAHGRPVVAFEPDPVLAACIRLSADLNGFSTLTVHQVGIGSERTTARLTGHPDGNVGAQGLKVGRAGVDVVPLDYYELAPQAIKIDVEGMELKVLHGARETIALHRPLLYVEAHKGAYKALAEWMADHGYERRARFNSTPTYYYAPRERAE